MFQSAGTAAGLAGAALGPRNLRRAGLRSIDGPPVGERRPGSSAAGKGDRARRRPPERTPSRVVSVELVGVTQTTVILRDRDGDGRLPLRSGHQHDAGRQGCRHPDGDGQGSRPTARLQAGPCDGWSRRSSRRPSPSGACRSAAKGSSASSSIRIAVACRACVSPRLSSTADPEAGSRVVDRIGAIRRRRRGGVDEER